MVLNANDLLEWKDFPKGLRVLLLEQETDSAAQTRAKLEEMDYIVSVFCNETESLSAISRSSEGFHVAIVESKSVENTFGDTVAETTFGNIVAESSVQVSPPQRSGDGDIRAEDQLANDSKDKSNESSFCSDKGTPMSTSIDAKTNSKASRLRNICGFKASRKKIKVDWTSELQAVEKLGVDQAIPSKILEVMKVEGLTRHNVASHLQKYRMQQRHILPKDRNYGSRKPVMVFPSYQNTSFVPGGQGYQGWIPPGSCPPGVQMWGAPYYPTWQNTENWHWPPYPAMHADAWGFPVMPPPPVGPCPPFPQSTPQCQNSDYLNISQMPDNLFDLCPAEEVIDKVVKEAISKPWLPLPLGLKPPSTDSVLNELSKQGISCPTS